MMPGEGFANERRHFAIIRGEYGNKKINPKDTKQMEKEIIKICSQIKERDERETHFSLTP